MVITREMLKAVKISPEEVPPPQGVDAQKIITAADPTAMQQKLLEPIHLAEYLGRYVHQGAIGNSRLLDIQIAMP